MSYQLNNLSGKTALITGASSGIGKDLALMMASEGLNLNLVARRSGHLEELRKEIQGINPEVQVKTLAIDINGSDLFSKFEDCSFQESNILINNAGLAKGKDFVGDLKNDDIDLVVTTNLISAIKITNWIVPFLKEKGEGDIVHTCSIAAKESYAGGSVYCATKFGLRAFNESLRKETYGQNIRAINISPGMVETEFSKVRFNDDEIAEKVYRGMMPLTGQDIAFQILNALKTPRHINIDELVILATDQGSATTVKRQQG